MKFLLSPEQMAADFAAAGTFPPPRTLLTNPLYTETMDSLGPQARWLADYGQQGFIYDMNTPYEAEAMAILQETWSLWPWATPRRKTLWLRRSNESTSCWPTRRPTEPSEEQDGHLPCDGSGSCLLLQGAIVTTIRAYGTFGMAREQH